MKNWLNRARTLLESSLHPFPQELNELDWKEMLSPNNDKLCKHLCAFANYPGGGLLVFGISDKSGKPVGVTETDASAIIERLGNLSRTNVSPVLHLDHATEVFEGVNLLYIFIRESKSKPVHLAGGTIEDTFIRSSGSTRKASRQEIGGLMLNSKTPQFEELHCSSLLSGAEVLNLLDYRSIFKLLSKPIPQENADILNWMKNERMVEEIDSAGFYITNFGAISAAHSLHDFDSLSRKSIRLIRYDGVNKLQTDKEYPGSKGYAIGFSGLISFIRALLPGSEIIKDALRTETTVYPEIALRELIANSLIHQDFAIRGAGPMIEIFDDRIEVTNPGKLLPSKQLDRLIGTNPESRNELIAGAFRRYNICEERGSGFQKAVANIELYGLPPLKFQEGENSFKIIMYSPKKFGEMTPEERIEAAYQHSIIKYFSSEGLTNTSLRERFRLGEKQASQISRLIKDAQEKGKIKPKDPNSDSKKFTQYLPYWG